MSKKKIINDPLYGFISISNDLVLEILDHPYFQRLRHINQLGLTSMVYPGALHTRFHHAIGAMHLMGKVLDTLRAKGVPVSDEEYKAARIAMLLHDIGHPPLSHTLEETLLRGVQHESLSYQFMKALNHQYGGALDLTIKIFRGAYERTFFHQLISSQMDTDRLDYLRRDSFFTGVAEGTFGVDRLIAMMNVVDDQLVVEEAGIHSIESFLHARRYMYWQVYLHKTAICAERMLVNIFKRAQYLALAGEDIPCTDALKVFITRSYSIEEFGDQISLLETFGNIDDHDVWGAIKLWQNHGDIILSGLCTRLMQRRLFRIELTGANILKKRVERLRQQLHKSYGILLKDTHYLYSTGFVTNEAYVDDKKPIKVLTRAGKLVDVATISELPTIKALSKVTKKNFICWPKSITL